MDLRTLVIASVAVSAAITAILLLLYRTHRTYPGFGYWVAGAASRGLAGVVLLLPRADVSGWGLVVVANYLLIFELLLYARGTQKFRGRVVGRRSWAAAAVAVLVGVAATHALVTPFLNAYVVVLSLAMTALALAMVWLLSSDRGGAAGAADLVLMCAWGALALVGLVRAGYTLSAARPLADMTAQTPVQAWLLLVLIVLALLIALGQLAMYLERIEHDVRKAQDGLERDIAMRIEVEAALRESEARFRRMADSAPVMIWLAEADGRRSWFNEGWLGFTGRALAHEAGDGWVAGVHPEDFERYMRVVHALPERRTPYRVEVRLRRHDGSYRWMLEAAAPRFDEAGAFLGAVGSCIDISDRREMEQALRDHLGQVQRHADQMTGLNRLNDRLLGCTRHAEAYDVISGSAEALFAPFGGSLAIEPPGQGRPSLVLAWGAPATLGPQGSWRNCLAVRRGAPVAWHDPTVAADCVRCRDTVDGGHVCVPFVARDAMVGSLQVIVAGRPSPYEVDRLRGLAVAVGEAITATLHNLGRREELREQSIRDPLTGLFNRRYLDERLPLEVARAAHAEEPLSVAMLDIDHFKRLNDRFGHLAGDAVLRSMGEVLRGATRGSDLVCRYGGEEITLIFPGCDLEVACARLAELRAELASVPVRHRNVDLPPVTVSVGVAARSGDETFGASDLIARADAALYQAKQQGRDRIVAFHEDLPADRWAAC